MSEENLPAENSQTNRSAPFPNRRDFLGAAVGTALAATLFGGKYLYDRKKLAERLANKEVKGHLELLFHPEYSKKIDWQDVNGMPPWVEIIEATKANDGILSKLTARAQKHQIPQKSDFKEEVFSLEKDENEKRYPKYIALARINENAPLRITPVPEGNSYHPNHLRLSLGGQPQSIKMAHKNILLATKNPEDTLRLQFDALPNEYTAYNRIISLNSNTEFDLRDLTAEAARDVMRRFVNRNFNPAGQQKNYTYLLSPDILKHSSPYYAQRCIREILDADIPLMGANEKKNVTFTLKIGNVEPLVLTAEKITAAKGKNNLIRWFDEYDTEMIDWFMKNAAALGVDPKGYPASRQYQKEIERDSKSQPRGR